MSWPEFVAFLMTSDGVNIVVGVLLSFLVELWPGYESLEPPYKRLAFGGLCLIIPILGGISSCASGLGVWGDFAGLWWPAIVAGWSAFFAGQIAHLRKYLPKRF